MTRDAIRQLIDATRPRYRLAGRNEKTRILNELAATTGYHRKALLRLLGRHKITPPASRPGRQTKYRLEFTRLLTKLGS